ncbi:SIS domain-containing protein [uncultured Roseobacter sp.]|uniref:SIS domain-containing protein n=1 Tax=uncultured Roseobacter sp. TaxID=114847 RepID=UPI00263759D0|nr:SIS domain-containing protein [uncultured Roseobacter sp.]
MSAQTHMRREILEIPAVVDTLLTKGAGSIEAAAVALQAADPHFMISVARGSSDHAATYFKYACELVAGIPVASVGPSVSSIYERELSLSHCACLSISQSGKSPDIVQLARMATAQGALSLALTNHTDSDLARVSTHAIDLHAGAELSVAATKTFVTSAVSAGWLLAEWQRDADLLRALHVLPEALESAAQMDWGALAADIASRQSLFCLGRGPVLAISNEAALKFKETCQLHAESYSSAEVLHGPVSIVEQGFPVIALTAADQAESSLVDVADQIAGKGASVFVTSDKASKAGCLPCVRTAHPLLDPISLIVSFYAMVEQVALSRGINPDEPRHLKKVTETV